LAVEKCISNELLKSGCWISRSFDSHSTDDGWRYDKEIYEFVREPQLIADCAPQALLVANRICQFSPVKGQELDIGSRQPNGWVGACHE